jgi:isoleucyl-tRNA synthetase
LDVHKDCLYCEAPGSVKRRSAQTALYQLTHGLTVLLAPLLSFTTEEAYLELRRISNPSLKESVFLEDLSALESVPLDNALNEKWLAILDVRSQVNDVLDQARKAGTLKSSQEACVHINPAKLGASAQALLTQPLDWPFLLQMSEVFVNGKDKPEVAVTIEATKNLKCERCWRYRPDVGVDSKHPTICGRCADVVK